MGDRKINAVFSPQRVALRVAAPYLVASLTYICISDLLVELLVPNSRMQAAIHLVKAFLFIGMTAMVIYLLVRWQVERAVRAERKSLEQETQFAGVFENAVSGMVILDLEGRLLRVNNMMSEILGYTREELLGSNVLDYVHPDDRAFRLEFLHRQSRGEKTDGPFELRYRHKTGRDLWLHVSSVLVCDAQQQPLCTIAQIVNTTDRRRTEEELQEHRAALMHASRLITLGELAAGLTHELTQPITAIGQYADVAKRRTREGRETLSLPMTEAIDGVYEEVGRARDIIERWREFARGQTPRPAAIDANEVLFDAMRLMAREARRKGVRWRAEMAENLPRVRADHVQIEQVVVNLIANAIDSLAEKHDGPREVRLQTRLLDNKTVRICVADNGPGIEPTHQPQLFQPFFTTKPDGIGLGLSISRSIIQSHGGALAYEFRDGWTAFHFELPISQEQAHVAA